MDGVVDSEDGGKSTEQELIFFSASHVEAIVEPSWKDAPSSHSLPAAPSARSTYLVVF